MPNIQTLPTHVQSKVLAKIDPDDPSWFQATRLELCQRQGTWSYDVCQTSVRVVFKDVWVTYDWVKNLLDQAKDGEILVPSISFRSAIEHAQLIQEKMLSSGSVVFLADNPREIQNLETFAGCFSPSRPTASLMSLQLETGNLIAFGSRPPRQDPLTY